MTHFLCPRLNGTVCLHGCIFIKLFSVLFEIFTGVPQLVLLHAAKFLWRMDNYCANGNTLNDCPFSENSKFLSLR